MADLLQKEQEYYQMNEQIQERTRQLLQEVDVVMKTKDHLANLQMKDISLNQSNCNGTPKKANESKRLSESISGEDWGDLIPPCATEMGSKGLIHFLKAKLKSMQVENDKLQATYKLKCEEFRKLQNDFQKTSDEKQRWFQINHNSKGNVAKLENQITIANSKLQSKENENIALRKEIEAVKKELKTLQLQNSNTDVRLTRAMEETEKLKENLKNLKLEEKDLRDSHRKQINELNGAIKQLEKQKIELLNGFKKQMLLIDNVKRQKGHLEVLKTIELAENEFSKILDWKPPTV